MNVKKTPGRLSGAILEMAEDRHRIGVMDDATYHKITISYLGGLALCTAEPIGGEENSYGDGPRSSPEIGPSA